MENHSERKCSYCQEAPAKEGSSFCSEWCFELWYSLQQAAIVVAALDALLPELMNANTRTS